MNRPIKIAYAEDHCLVRKCIVRYIKSFDGCEVILEAGDGHELISQLEETPLLPDLCILDIFMPRMNGLETMLKIKARWPRLKALVLTANNTDYYLSQLLLAGANGFLVKDCEPERLEKAIRAIDQDGIYSPDLHTHKYLLSLMSGLVKPPMLTPEEISLLQYCCSDLSYAQIADKMSTTICSVDWHRNSLFKKLHVHSRSGLVIHAIQFGLVELCVDVTGKSVVRHT